MKVNKSALKIGALIIAVCLIVALLTITNAFVGNPISTFYANRAIKNYVIEKYSYLDLVTENARYNFISGEYKAIAKSPTSIDTHFPIYYRNGMILRDEYDSYVLGKLNTLIRLQNEYSELVISILSNVTGLENNRSRVQIEKWEYEKTNDYIKLDMKFDKNLPIDMKVIISANLNDNSLKNIANIL